MKVVGTKRAVNVLTSTCAMYDTLTERWADTTLLIPQKFCRAVSLLCPAGCHSKGSSVPFTQLFQHGATRNSPARLTIWDKWPKSFQPSLLHLPDALPCPKGSSTITAIGYLKQKTGNDSQIRLPVNSSEEKCYLIWYF